MNRVKLERLTTAVQANCDIADARHAREMTMCNYLLAMRELYRWEAGLPLRQPLKQAELSAWIARREALWNELEDAEFRPLPIGGGCDPFDNAAINDALAPQGLVYAGGLGRWGKPHFFLGELARQETRHGLTVLVSEREHARDLFAPPAALREGLVFLRLDALRRWLWEKTEIWGVRQADGALKAALDGYGFADDAEAALERMAARESEVLILHEVGEGMAEPLLGADWRAMLVSLSQRRAELLARAVRDHLADCLSTLPALLERGAEPSIHFYFANFDGLRRSLFPRLTAAYATWRKTGDDADLRMAYLDGQTHWREAALRLLATWRKDPGKAETTFSGWVDEHGPLML
ncbi:MAG: hypothetical protein K8F53_13145 [Rhodocyclaceae bacterium]|jgi:hypothetical protein|nr:hypothetical protein [Rhodocyclaceae bacterium]